MLADLVYFLNKVLQKQYKKTPLQQTKLHTMAFCPNNKIIDRLPYYSKNTIRLFRIHHTL